MNSIKKSLFIAFLLFFVTTNNYVFAEFGESCVPVLNSNQFDIDTKSSYGYVIKNIKIKDLRDDIGCKIKEKEALGNRIIIVGFRKAEGANDIVEVSFREGQEDSIGTISGSYISKIPVLKDLKIKAEISTDAKSLCLTMKTQYGKAYLVCRKLEEGKPEEGKIEKPEKCKSTIAESCFQTSAESKSKNFFNFSGQLMECVRASVSEIIYQKNDCPEGEIKFGISPISTFRSDLSRYVGFMLTIYIIFYGFRMAADPANFSSQDVIISVIKVITVVAVTSGPNFGFSSGINRNLLDEYFLPLALDLMDLFSSAVMNSNQNGLCSFDSSYYQEGYKYYSVFDAIDCRIGLYLGIPPEVSEDINLIATLPVVVFFTLIGGHIVLCLCLMTFLIFFIDIVLRFIAAIIVYIVTLYAMVYVSIIYIPTILFEKTRQYYDSWQRVVVSMIIQPFIITAFLVMFFNVFDNIMFKDCDFKRSDPDENGKVSFFISDSSTEKCKNSFGYTLLEYRKKENWKTVRLILFKISIPKIIFGFENPLVYIEIVMWIMIFHFIMNYSYSLAAEISGGPSIILEKANKKENDKDKKASDKKTPKKKDAGDKDKASASGSGDKDKVSSGGGDKDETSASGGGDKDEASAA